MARGREIPPLASYYDKPATGTQQRFATWLIDQVGLDLRQMTPQEAFLKAVALSTVLRGSFQASNENQEHLARRRKERRMELDARDARRAARDGEEPQPSSVREPSTNTSEPDSQREPAGLSDATPPARSRRRGGSRASRAAAKAAEDRPTVTGPAGPVNGETAPAVPDADPFADDFDEADAEEGTQLASEIEAAAPVGSAWLGGASAARAGKPADGGRGVLRPSPW